jgi:hypothetical protein
VRKKLLLKSKSIYLISTFILKKKKLRRLAAAWPPPGRRLAAAWPPPGRRLAAAWPPPGQTKNSKKLKKRELPEGTVYFCAFRSSRLSLLPSFPVANLGIKINKKFNKKINKVLAASPIAGHPYLFFF